MEDIFDKLQAITGISKYSNSEVITPLNIVKDMVYLLPADVFNPDTKFLDPAVKSGRFLIEIYHRLMNSPLLAHIPESDRQKHIIENQLYGLATSPVAATVTRKALYGNPSAVGNIVYIDHYLTLMADKGTDFHKLIEKEFGQMKFDVVIGNPPYQQDTGGGNGGGASTLYDKFVLRGIEVSSRYICFITPARWYTDESRVKDLKDKLIDNHKMRELHDFPNTSEVFENVYIMGGVCYYLYDKEWNDLCKIIEHRDGKVIESHRFLKESFSDSFIRNSTAVSIVSKAVSDTNFVSIYDYIQDYNVFKLRSYEKGNAVHSNLTAYWSDDKENLPATKYLEYDIMLFWWLEKNKDLSTKQLVEELYALICNRISNPITYQELKNRKMGLDTKGIIPVQV